MSELDALINQIMIAEIVEAMTGYSRLPIIIEEQQQRERSESAY